MVEEDKSKKDEKDYNRMLFAIDEGNKRCVDCSNDLVTHVSINNGVALCQECAAKHSALGSAISYLRTLDEEWDDYLFNFFIFGSNTKFVSSLQLFSIDNAMEIEKKYQTVGCDYYRKSLKAKVLGSKPLDNITFTNGSEILETPQDEFPEFKDYHIKIKEKKSAMKNIQGFFGKIGKKVNDMKITEKIKSGGVKTWGEMKKAGTFLSEKTAPATNKIKQGAFYVSSHVKTTYTDVKSKLTKKNTMPTTQVNVDFANQNEDDINKNDDDKKQQLDEDNKPSELI